MKLSTIIVVVALAGGGFYIWSSQFSDSPPTQAPGRFGGGGGGGGFGRQQPPLVSVAPVGRERMFDTVDAIGTARANESLTLTAKVTDTVSAVDFEDGDYVDAGAVLVQLTNSEEEALLDEARANLDDAESQLARLENLAQQNLAPESELDVARARADASRARLNTVVARLSDRLIRAPFSGVLGFREVSPGTLLQPNTAITTLDDISIIKLDFTVPETFYEAMQPGSAVLARAASYPDRDFEGEVRTVGSRVDPVTRAIQVRAHIDNADRALRPGMLLTVRVVMAERNALVVPENAVFQIQDRAYVYTLSDESVVNERQIRTGDRNFGIVEVLDGLEEGELIVTEGIVKLRNGMRVRTEAGAQAPDAAGYGSGSTG